MGFYFRKSISVGPLRFNLSNSGIGISAGLRCFRFGTGPRGNYIHIGAGGLHYRAAIPPSPQLTSPPRPEYDASPTHSPMLQVGSDDVSKMVDSSSMALLSELNEKSRRIRWWRVAAVVGIVLFFALFSVGTPSWVVAVLAAIMIVGVYYVFQFDVMSKTVVIMYDSDSEMETIYQRLHDSFSQLSRCAGKWHIDARSRVYDPKYHAGAGQLVSRNEAYVRTGCPPYVLSNIEVPNLVLKNITLYFFPERLLVCRGDNIGAVSYEDLDIVIGTFDFIEDGDVPRDAEVIGSTWSFVNKDGGPDRRFKDNRVLPICNYEELWLISPTGLNEVVQVSRTGIGSLLDDAVQNLANLVAKAKSMPRPVAATVRNRQETIPPTALTATNDVISKKSVSSTKAPDAEELTSCALLEILCCMMVADGRASKSEKKCIRYLLKELHSPWSDADVENKIASFIHRVQIDGYRKTLSKALIDIELFKHNGRKSDLYRCLDAVANADNEVTIRELQLSQRIKTIVGEHE